MRPGRLYLLRVDLLNVQIPAATSYLFLRFRHASFISLKGRDGAGNSLGPSMDLDREDMERMMVHVKFSQAKESVIWFGGTLYDTTGSGLAPKFSLHNDTRSTMNLNEIEAAIDLDTTLRTFAKVALQHRDRYINDLDREDIPIISRVLKADTTEFKMVLGQMNLPQDEYTSVYSLHFYATNPSTESPPDEQRIPHANGLILNDAIGLSGRMSDKAREIGEYLERHDIPRLRS
ncbi:hypothetical protein BGZ51_006892 [Haplosporangium sp. Z 767]|nr:hypothetical protein BGZ50_000208 [Haplosporangium sp. Z 11]KAF9191673.1 hypothetical protein BGZ51_006892 [Haplosporangium sp. Z 767]